MNDFHQIAELSPISDEQASQIVSPDTHADLVAAITSTLSWSSSSSAATHSRTRRVGLRLPSTRRWPIAAPVVLGVAGALLIAGLVWDVPASASARLTSVRLMPGPP